MKFQNELSLNIWRRLSQVYRSPLDIDLFPGGMAEIPGDSDSLVGPTFGCIIATQFHQIKFGDRYQVTDKCTLPIHFGLLTYRPSSSGGIQIRAL